MTTIGNRIRANAASFARGLTEDLRQLFTTTDPFVGRLLIGFVVFELLWVGWDQPGFYGWENDGAAPRGFFQGIADNLLPGHAHRYPLFHYLLIGILCVPVLLIDLAVAGLSGVPLVDVVVSTPSMTAIAVLTKLLHLGMTGLGLLAAARIWTTLFDARSARWALAFTVTNTSVAYYGRVTNVDTAYLMWVVLAMDRLLLLRQRSGAYDYAALALFAAAALATKDPAYAPFALGAPIYLMLAPGLGRGAFAAREQHWRRLAQAVGLGLVFYAVLSGALFNPTGFVARMELLTGTNSQDWRQYPPTLQGLQQNLRDLIRWQDDFFWPMPVVISAWLGAVIAPWYAARLAPPQSPSELGWRRWFSWMPLVFGLSSVATFTLLVGRAEHRFMLVLGYCLAGYAGVFADALVRLARHALTRGLTLATCSALLGLAIAQNFELGLTQLFDSRRDVERFLARLPEGTHVETYGLGVYLPRFNPRAHGYSVSRVNAKAWGTPAPINGVQEVFDDFMDYRRRGAEVLVVPEGFLNRFTPPAAEKASGAMDRYRSAPGAMRFFGHILTDSLPGYRRLEVGRLNPPDWYLALGGRLLRVHGSTGREVWVLLREDFASID